MELSLNYFSCVSPQEKTGKELEIRELGFNTLVQLLERVDGVAVMKPPDAGFMMVYGPKRKGRKGGGGESCGGSSCGSETEEVNWTLCGCLLTHQCHLVLIMLYILFYCAPSNLFLLRHMFLLRQKFKISCQDTNFNLLKQLYIEIFSTCHFPPPTHLPRHQGPQAPWPRPTRDRLRPPRRCLVCT